MKKKSVVESISNPVPAADIVSVLDTRSTCTALSYVRFYSVLGPNLNLTDF
jgi:hypothetical protein